MLKFFLISLYVKLEHLLKMFHIKAVLSVKDGVIFITSIRGSGSFIIGFLRSGLILAVNPLAFLMEKREPTIDETDVIVQVISFLDRGFREGMNEATMIQVARETASWDLDHEGMLYLVRLGLDMRLIEVADVPFELVPLETDDDDVVEIEFDLYQFIIDNSYAILSCVALGCIGVILYLFRPRNPKSPGSGTSECHKTDDPKNAQQESTSKEIIREPISKSKSIWKYTITVYASWVLFIRSFFIKEKPWFIPSLLVILHLNLYLKIFPAYEIKTITNFFLWLGIYCIAIDSLGSLISSYALSGTSNLFDQVIPFLLQPQGNIIADFYLSSGFTALLIGKTAMTATGRAALGVGVISGTGYLINAHLERNHKSVENQKNRESASDDARKQREFASNEARKQRESASNEARKQREFASNEARKQRDWQDQKDRQKAYESSWNPFKTPPK